MATGNFWNVDDPAKPWGLFDPDAELVIPVEIEDWLVTMGTTYSAHEVIAESPLECVSDVHASGVIYVRMRLLADAAYTAGTKYPFTLRLTGAGGADGGGPQIDDRTLWLKVKPR